MDGDIYWITFKVLRVENEIDRFQGFQKFNLFNESIFESNPRSIIYLSG